MEIGDTKDKFLRYFAACTYICLTLLYVLTVFRILLFFFVGRSLIPAPPTRRLSNGHISPLHKTGRQPVPVDGKRKIGIGK